MSLTLYFHPLSSFCQKVLIALYENETPFWPRIVDLMNETDRAEFLKIQPLGKFPVLRDEARELTVPESSIIIEYLDLHYPGTSQLLPTDAERARRVRLTDRFYDHYVMEPMQKIVGDRLRPEGKKDPFGVEQAKARLDVAYGLIERGMEVQTWAGGDAFSMADCAAAPALFYANKVRPFTDTYKNVTAYFDRLMLRPSYARVLREAQPYLSMFPR
jgi:glutathione S-transferase